MSDLFIVFCDKCENMIGVEALDNHSKYCISKIKVIEINKTESNKIDIVSENPIKESNIITSSHGKNKKEKKNTQNVKSTLISQTTLELLLPNQIKAVNWCFKKAKIYHNSIYPNTVIRFLELGYTEEDVINCLDYIKNIDVIVHFGRGCYGPVPWLKSDTKLKNAFEIYRGNEYLLSREQ